MKHLLIVLLLSGCAAVSPEDRAERMQARHSPYCSSLGFQKGTPDWALCIERQAYFSCRQLGGQMAAGGRCL